MKKRNLEFGREYFINNMKGEYIYKGINTLEGFNDEKGKKIMFHVFLKDESKNKKIDRRLQVNIYEDSPIKIKDKNLIVSEKEKVFYYIDLKTKWHSRIKSSLNPVYFERFKNILEGGEK